MPAAPRPSYLANPGRGANGISAFVVDQDDPGVSFGIAQGALDYAAGYVQQREQFGQPVASFQGVQFMLADMAMKLEAARQLTYHAAILSERAMRGEKHPGMTFASSAAKCFASDAAMVITTDAVQLLGGYGYVKDYPLERMMRDAKITQIYEGTNQIQRMVMARQLLKGLMSPTDLRILGWPRGPIGGVRFHARDPGSRSCLHNR